MRMKCYLYGIATKTIPYAVAVAKIHDERHAIGFRAREKLLIEIACIVVKRTTDEKWARKKCAVD